MEGRALPNIEDPSALIRQHSDTPEPAGAGFKAPHWQPRAQFAGTYDEHWQSTRAPYLPVDYQQRFQSAAHPDLVYPGFLTGGEAVNITHMHSAGALQFTLPTIILEGRVRRTQHKVQPLNFAMESLIIEPNVLQLHMVWKAATTCDKHGFPDDTVDLGLVQYSA